MKTHDLGIAGLKVAPPITVFAMTLNEWVAVATVLYLILQGAYIVWQWRQKWRAAHPEPKP